jgi:hypothetical protein
MNGPRTRLFAAALAMTAWAAHSAIAQEPDPHLTVKLDLLPDRIWVEVDPSNDLPGVMTTFLSDGTLLFDSCWETYSVTRWKRLAARKLTWDENGIPVAAEVKSLSPDGLVLAISAGRYKTEHRYVPVKTPFICPDMKK